MNKITNNNYVDSNTTKTTIKKWGNSQGIRIPKGILDQINLHEEDELEIIVDEEILVIRKIKKKYKNLKERIEDFHGKPFEEITYIDTESEIPWGLPEGNEFC